MSKVLAFFIMVLLIGCDSEINSFKDIKLREGDLLIFFNYPNEIGFSGELNELQKEYGNFYIDDSKVLRIIQDNLFLSDKSYNNAINTFYNVKLLHNGKVLYAALYDIENKHFLSEKDCFKFDMKIMEEHSNSLRKLNGYYLECENVLDARVLFKELERSNIFIDVNKEGNLLYLYSGETVLSLKNSSKESDYWKIEESVKSDISKIQDAIVSEFLATSDDDIIQIKVLSKRDISAKISSEYTIIENFQLLKNVEFPVFGVSKPELQLVLDKLHLNNVKLIEISYE